MVSSQPWRLLVHTRRKTMLFTSSRRVRLTASVVSPQAVFICSTGVLAAASVPPGAGTWNSILDLTHANVHESLKSTPAVQFTLSTCMIALHLWLFSVGRHRQHTNTHADLFLVTIVHVGADTPHILQTHVSPTVQMLPRRQIHCP